MTSVLLIEDDHAIGSAYSTVLKQEGYTVFLTSNGPDGLSLIKKEHIDLILLDIMLPNGVNGFDVLRRLKMRDETKNIPVVVMTNLDSEKQACLDYGAADYFIKAAMNVKELVEKVKQIAPISAS